jgi:N-acetylmuramoyl-L-alanine amidase
VKTHLTVHASMTSPCENLTLAQLDRRDRQFGLSKVGYHFVIRRDGTVEVGRSLDEASMHDDLKMAKQAVSVCLVGGVNDKREPSANFTDEQKDELVALMLKHPELKVQAATPSLTGEKILSWSVRIKR